MNDQEESGCSVRLAEWFDTDNLIILKSFIRQLLSDQKKEWIGALEKEVKKEKNLEVMTGLAHAINLLSKLKDL